MIKPTQIGRPSFLRSRAHIVFINLRSARDLAKLTFVLRLIAFARLSRGVVMVNECVGPDRDGCTAKTVTDAKYGKHSRDGGNSSAERATARLRQEVPAHQAGLGRSLRCPHHTHLVTLSPCTPRHARSCSSSRPRIGRRQLRPSSWSWAAGAPHA
jgi:hypothetical protein